MSLALLPNFKPKFTKRFANLTEAAVSGIQQYVREVKEGVFPDREHSYSTSDETYQEFAKIVAERKG